MRKIILLLSLLTALQSATFSQPATEVYLFDLKIKRDKMVISNGRNISNHKGYDNQPFFHTDRPLLYYVSADSAGRTDIIAYDYKSKQQSRVTATHDREYSPTLTPDKQFISCIVQNDSGAQHLVKYAVADGTPHTIINDLIVGYHAWGSENTVAVFTLPAPFKLHLIDVFKKSDKVVATDIGRSLHKIPGRKAVSFIQKDNDGNRVINSLDVDNHTITFLTESLPGESQDMAWTPGGRIVMSDGRKIFYCQPTPGGWKEIEVEPALPLKDITRLAISADGKLLALVMGEL
jgi:hypothetical protein